MENVNTVDYFRGIPLRRLIVYYFFSGGLYLFYWFYCNWKELKEYNNINRVKPGWLTLGMIIPIYNMYLLYDLWKSYKEYSSQQGVTSIKCPGLMSIIYITIFLAPTIIFDTLLSGFSKEHPIYFNIIDFFIYTCGILMIMYSQTRINGYWRTVEPKKSVVTSTTLLENIILIVGLIFLLVQYI